VKLPTTRSRAWRVSWPVLTACVAVSLAACSAGASGSEQAKQDPKAPILVWADSTRQPAFEAYQKAHPQAKLKIEVIDGGALLSKIQLANRVGKGWPDVIFDGDPNQIASLASPQFDYAQPLDTLVPKDVQDQFAAHNGPCTVDGKLSCLQNDVAQDVLYVNKPLMAKFGYEVPKTWNDYQALGEKVSKEHPGYLLGGVGETNLLYEFFWGSQCPLNNVKGANQVQINTKDTKCTRVAKLLDPMLANGSVSRLSPFDPAYIAKVKAGKLLMTPGPSWFGDYVLKADSTYAIPKGQIAVEPEPLWDGESTNYSGTWGGGIYVVSKHAKNLAGAVDVAKWVSTDPAYQKTAPTYPAYGPAAKIWLEAKAKDPWYAQDPSAVFTDAASKISPSVQAVRYQIAPSVMSTTGAAVKSGKTIESSLADLQSQLSSMAQTAGYEVTDN
jgi:ABC-type glycerol-3-phosphate transport system substrate-binding protein